MKDAAFTKLLQRAARVGNRAQVLLEKCEAEYERRYGKNPSDAYDDSWIDSMHGAGGRLAEDMTAEKVEEGAIGYANLERVNK